MENIYEELRKDFMISEEENFNSVEFQYRIKNWKTKEWGKITIYKNREWLFYQYANLSFFKDFINVDEKYTTQEEISEEVPAWFKELILKAEKIHKQLMGENKKILNL